MPNPFRRSFRTGALVPVLLLCLSGLTASRAIAQSTPIPAGLQKQLDRIDLAISGAGILTNTVSGVEQRDAHVPTIIGGTTYISTTSLSINPSNSVGELVALRYTAKPYVGFEFNFVNSRYNNHYIYTTVTTPKPPAPLPNPSILPGGAQNNVHEWTLGYIAHPRSFFGIQPFLGAGGGTMQFRPTPGGGEGLPRQWRAVYYYTLGAEGYFPTSNHFGMRLGFRQLIYLAPDFGQNYLTITKRARTSEPNLGFFVRF